jgi:hypothetical protein
VVISGAKQTVGSGKADEGVEVQSVVAALVTDEFWSCFEQRPLQISASARNILGSFDVEGVVKAYLFSSMQGCLSAEKHGEPYIRDSLFMAYLDQASLSLKEAEKHFPLVLRLCNALAVSFDYVTATLLLDPPGRRAPILVDDDIAIVQLWGTRHYTVAQRLTQLRVTQRRPPPLLSATLTPGDALYVPRNLECRLSEPSQVAETGGIATEEPSLCLMIKLRGADQGFAVSLTRHLIDLLREGLSPENDSFFRSAITKHTFDECNSDSSESGQVEGRLHKACSELASKVTLDGLGRHYQQRMTQLREEQQEACAEVSGQMPRLPENLVLPHCYVRVSSGVTCHCNAGDHKAFFRRGTETLQLPIARTASYLISELQDGRPHQVDALTCADPLERLCVCQILVFKECLELVVEQPVSHLPLAAS